MSRRITTQTEMKDREHVEAACKLKGITYAVSGNTIRFDSGSLRGATLNLTTGEIIGDSDWHKRNDLGALHQAYAEAAYTSQLLKTGGYVESRTVEKEDIVLVCVAHG